MDEILDDFGRRNAKQTEAEAHESRECGRRGCCRTVEIVNYFSISTRR